MGVCPVEAGPRGRAQVSCQPERKMEPAKRLGLPGEGPCARAGLRSSEMSGWGLWLCLVISPARGSRSEDV